MNKLIAGSLAALIVYGILTVVTLPVAPVTLAVIAGVVVAAII